MRVIYLLFIGLPIGRRLWWLVLAFLLWPTAGMAQHHDNDWTPCDTTPVKFPFHDTILYVGDTCALLPLGLFNHNLLWNFKPFGYISPLKTEYEKKHSIYICHLDHTFHDYCDAPNTVMHAFGHALNDDLNTFACLEASQDIVPSSYSVESDSPECPDRKGDTIYIHFVGGKRPCDSTPVKLPFHDTAFCEGDSLLIVATDRPHAGYSTIWHNLSSVADVIHEGDSIFITEPGIYAFSLINTVDNGCPDREGDTVNVALYPKPRPFLPHDTLEACGSRTGALTFTSDQPHIAFLWNDGDTASSYRFAFRGDTLDQRFCTLYNTCGDTLTDSVIVRFLPPYAYLGGDSLVGCRGDSVLFDMGQYNRHLPNYDDLRFVWTLRGDTLRDGRTDEADNPNDESDPTRLRLYFPQDTGLLTVNVFLPDAGGNETDNPDATPDCPVAADTIDLQLYIWPDIDFFVRNGDTTICHYDSIGLFLDRDSLVFSPDAYYIWLFDSVPFDTTADKIIYAADSGVYTVTGVNHCSRHSESFVLHHHPKERITVVMQDTTVCPETPVAFDPTLPYGGNRYVWFKGGEGGADGEGDYEDDDSGDGGNYMQFRNPGEAPEDGDIDAWPWDASAEIWIDTPGTYTLYVMDTAGCMAYSELNITEEDCTPQFEAPNVFTPNGDGINDVFKLKTMEKLFEFEIRIFNRWGNQVLAFKGEPEDFQWDGKIKGNGQDATDGVYFYVATFKDYKGKKKKQSGSVTILR